MDFARMIARHDYPFNMAEHEYFQKYINGVNPMVKFYTRNTRRADMIKLHNEMKIELQDLFDRIPSRFSLTTDLWAPDNQEIGYCCVTCHFIDNDWKLHKKIITYQVILAPHTGEALSEFIKSQVLAWNIDKKIFSITVDNAANNDVMVRELREWLCFKGVLALNGDLFHLRCSAHILNLIVQDGLQEIEGLLQKIRESVKFTKSSQGRHQNFLNALAQTKLVGKGVCFDVPTRWNSTYLMVESALNARLAFERLSELAPDYKCLPSSEEWEVGRVICECLKIFHEITLHFSGVKYSTANLYFKGVCDVQHNIIQWKTSEHDYIRRMTYRMSDKFDKYWRKSNLLMGIGVVLDPCYKMAFIEYAFEALYGENAEIYVKKVRDSMNELYSKYEILSDCSIDQGGSSFSGGLGKFSCGSSSIGSSIIQEGFKKFIKQRSENFQQVQKTELDKYLEEDLFPLGKDDKGFDILYLWKNNGPKFPTLAKMARDILAVLVSSVASESAFSAGGRIITESRSSLGEDVVEALICVRDWFPSLKDIVKLDE